MKNNKAKKQNQETIMKPKELKEKIKNLKDGEILSITFGEEGKGDAKAE